MLDDVLFDLGATAKYYEVNWSTTPYWGAYVVLGLAEAIGGAFFAAKVIVTLNILLLPWSFMRLLIALGRSPRTSLLAFLIVWDVSMLWGWVAFSLSMALALLVIAWVIEAKKTYDFYLVALGTAAVALTHLHGLAVLGTAGVAAAATSHRSGKQIAASLLSLLAGALVLLPWLYQVFDGHSGGASYRIIDAPLSARVSNFFAHTYGYFPQEWAANPTALAYLVLTLFPIALGVLQREPGKGRSTLVALGIAGSLLLLYLALPQSVIGPTTQVYTFQRLAPYFLLSLLTLPRPDVRGRRGLVYLVALCSILWLHGAVARQASEYAKNTRPYLKIIDAVPPYKRVLPLDLEINDPALPPWGAVGQLHGWLAGAKSSYDPHLFAFHYLPLRYRKPQPPHPNWSTILRGRVKVEPLLDHYDYVIVYPKERDRFGNNPRLHRVVESGRWTLYEVKPKD